MSQARRLSFLQQTDGTVIVPSTATSVSTITGALQVAGGAGIGGNLHVGGEIVANRLTIQLTTVTTTLIETDDIIRTVNTTQSSSTTTGALQISGGAGIGGNLYVGGTIFGNINATTNTATNANNIATIAQTANASHFPVFVDSNNASSAYELAYTTSSFAINPATGNVGIGTSSPNYRLDVAGSISMHDEAQDLDNRYYAGTYLRGWSGFASGSESNITYATTSTSPVGNEVLATTATQLWARGPRIRLDRTQNYEVEMWIRKTAGASSGTYYMVVSNWDANGAVIVGDGTDWHYPVSNAAQSSLTTGTWVKHSFVVGPYGGLKNHSTSAAYISVGFIVNYGGAFNDSIELTGFKCRPIPKYSNDALTIFNNGSVGIGTTATTTRLDVAGGARITGITTVTNTTQATSISSGALQVAGGVGISGNLWVGGTINATIQGTSTNANNIATVAQTANATHFPVFVDTNNAASAYELAYTTSSFTINPSTGNIGVGTDTPRATMHIYGNGQLTANLTDAGNRGSFLRVSHNDTAAGSGGGILFANIQGDNANSLGFAAIKGLLVNGSNNTVGDLVFSTRATVTDTSLTERVRILSGGSVGIGTSSPGVSTRLQVAGRGLFTAGALDPADGTPSGVGISYDTAGNVGHVASLQTGVTERELRLTANPLTMFSAGSERMRITAAGSVGIGTTNPLQRLSVRTGGQGTDGVIIDSAATNNPWLRILPDSGSAAYNNLVQAGDQVIAFSTGTIENAALSIVPWSSATSGIRITSAGNVGIGIATPLSRLHVSGSARITGITTVTDTTQATSTSSGALQVIGGVGIGGNLWVGGTINATIQGIASTATNANNIATVAQTANANYFPVFVDANNATSAYELAYTTSSFVVNPSTGNVGIGINPSVRLDVSAGALGTAINSTLDISRVQGTNSNATQLVTRLIRVNTGTDWTTSALRVQGVVDVTNMGYIDFIPTGGTFGLAFGTAPSGVQTERMRIDVNGNVGIGTTAPSTRLDISGGARITGVTTVTDTTNASSTATGALQVVGGVGIGGNLHVGGTIFGNLNATVNTATNISGGATGRIPIQSGVGTTAFIPTGTDGQLLQYGTNTATWISTSSLRVGSATNVAGGAANQIVFQTGANTSGFVAAPTTTGQILQWNGSNIVWATTGTLTAGIATTASNISGGTAGQLVYQVSPGVSGFAGPGTSGQILVSAGAAAPVYTNTSSIHVGTANFAVTAGSATNTTNATNATNIAGGTAGQLVYQSGAGATTFAGPGTAGQLLQSNGTSAPTYVNTASVFVGNAANAVNATNATNIAGGAAGRIPIQSGAGATAFIPTGSNNQVLTWSGSTATWATPAGGSSVETSARTTNAAHFLTFVDSNNASATAETVYTTSSFAINPSTGNVGIGTTSPGFSLQVSGGVNYGDMIATSRFGVIGNNLYFGTSNWRYVGDGHGYAWNQTGTNGSDYVLNYAGNNASGLGAVAAINERMRITAAGNVGIGTSSPTYPLTVQSASSAEGIRIVGRTADGIGTLDFTNAAQSVQQGYIQSSGNIMLFGTGGTERMRITAAGNVGIGTTAPGYPLTVQASTSAEGIRIVGRAADSIGTFEFTNSAQSVTQGFIQSSGNNLLFATGTTERMRIDSSGNVGIGTTGAGARLDVAGGNVRIANNVDLQFRNAAGTGTARFTLQNDDNFVVYNASGTPISSFTQGATNIAVYGSNNTNRMQVDSINNVTHWTVNGSERMRINSSGELLVGTTTGGRTVCTFAADNWMRMSNGSRAWLIGPSNSVNFSIFDETAGLNRFFIDANGTWNGQNSILLGSGQNLDNKLEIGAGRTGNNFAYIDLIGDTTYTDYGLRLLRGGDGANAVSQLAHRGTGDFAITTQEAAPLIFNTSNTERMRITGAGNVGIGTNAPGARLAVAGSISASQTTGNYVGFGTGTFSFDGTTVVDYGISYTQPAGAFNTVLSGFTSLKFTTAQTERMRIDSSGNIGIGTNNPQYILHVRASEPYLALDATSATTRRAAVSFRKNNSSLFELGTDIYYNNTNTLYIFDNVANATRLTVESSGSIVATVDFRAPIFYDSNDPTFYLDPNGTSNLLNVGLNLLPRNANANWNTAFTNTPITTKVYHGDQSGGTNSPGGTWWFYESMRHSNNTNHWGTQIAWGWEDNANRLLQRNVSSGTFSGWVEYLNTSGRTFSGSLTMNNLFVSTGTGVTGGLRLANPTGGRDYRVIQKDDGRFTITDETAGAERLTINSSGNVTAVVDMRAPIFYDSNNTGFYVDPASASTSAVLNGLVVGGSSASTNVNTANDTGSFSVRGSATTVASMSFHRTTAYAINMGLGTDNVFRIGGWSASNDALTLTGAGVLTALADMRAPIFYDSNNTAFYFDGASTTNINTLSGNGKTAIETSDTYLRINQSSTFTSGTWFGGTLVRADGFYAGSNGGTTSSRVHIASGTNNGSRVIFLDGGDGSITAAGNITAYSSDRRLKTNIAPISNAIDKVMSIGGYTFDWVDAAEELGFIPDLKTNDAGVLAQEIEAVLPQAVAPAPFDWQWDEEEGKNKSKTGENYLTVRYERIVPLLIEAIKEQQKIIDSQNDKINTLDEKLNSIITLLGQK